MLLGPKRNAVHNAVRNDYRPLTLRRRLLVLVLGISTALTVAWMLLERPGGLHGPKSKVEAPTCLNGQTTECVGGKVDVLVVPAPVQGQAAKAASATAR